MFYLTILFLGLFYLYLEHLFYYHLEFKMLRLINLSLILYKRGEYYEKKNFVIDTLSLKLSYYEKILISDYQLNIMYRKLLRLYPTQPYIL